MYVCIYVYQYIALWFIYLNLDNIFREFLLVESDSRLFLPETCIIIIIIILFVYFGYIQVIIDKFSSHFCRNGI